MLRSFATSSKSLPTYPDGKFSLYEVKRTDESFATEYLHDLEKAYYFRELAIYDKTRIQFQVQDKEVTKKLMVPVNKDFEGKKTVIILEGVQHDIFNATTVTNQEGIRELELTCTKVQANYSFEVIDDEVGT